MGRTASCRCECVSMVLCERGFGGMLSSETLLLLSPSGNRDLG